MIDKLRSFNSVIDKINLAIGKAVSYLIFLLMLFICFEVIMRYVFNSPTSWSLELNTFILCGLIVFGGAFTLLSNGHVNVDIIYSRFSLRTRSIISLVTFLVAIFFLVMIIWKGWAFGLRSFNWQETTASGWNPPIWPIKFLVPLGAFLLLTQVIATYLRFIIQAITGQQETKEASEFLEMAGEE